VSRQQTRTALVTGFPGFLGKRLVGALARRHPELRFALLVQERELERAEAALAQLDAAMTDAAARCSLLVGDITDRHLGQRDDGFAALQARVTEVWHLAALYDLAATERAAYRVNVVGTVNLLDFAQGCAALEAFNHVSTCYVSGRRTGLVREVELDEGQEFKNHYESTKFWSEVEVQRRIDRLPIRVFRPGIVVGDSQTGQTDKYDGPYYIIKLLLRLPDGAPTLNLGDGAARVNIVPVDYVVAAMTELGARPDTLRRVFHLADPNPMRARDIVDLMLRTMGKAPALGHLSPALVELALRLKPLSKAAQVPREALIYFNHDARYDTTHTQEALADTPLRCPHLSTYLDTLINFVERHPQRPPPPADLTRSATSPTA
jgi:thioester reductase-like protein